MDILPRSKKPRPTPVAAAPPKAMDKPSPVIESKYKQPIVPKRPFYVKWQFWALSVLALFAVSSASIFAWYHWALQPVDAADTQSVRIIVASGQTSADIIEILSGAGLIRSKLATRLYIDTSGKKHTLQAGGYVLSRNLSVENIVDHIAGGKTDELNVTVLPGLTLKQLADPEVKGSLAQQGFTAAEIQEAFAAAYDSPLLADRPQGQSLEGYIFPETYRMNAGDKLSSIFARSFDELYQRLQKDSMIEKLKAHGLNIHQALTLASIVQKEVGDPTTQKQVAQVFYKRLADGMVLGSDVTFEYAAAQLGVTPAVDIDSPYNTRRNPGLPPGPIANMNYTALQAVADPAPGDYLYFVAGDDGVTYFSRSVEEHEANVAAHCHELCSLY